MDRALADRLAKCLRMLTSSYEGEIISAAARINGIVQANDLDWDAILNGGGRDLTREQMTQIYNTAYARGLEEGAKASKANSADWAPAGRARADEVGERIDEVEEILNTVDRVGGSKFEVEFCESMRDRLESWGPRCFVSEKQWGVLDRIRNRLQAQGHI